MELPYLGHTYPLAEGGQIDHRVEGDQVWVWVKPPDGDQVLVRLTQDETLQLGVQLIQEFYLARYGWTGGPTNTGV
jgi:hypothetical protein